jgi:hypothetical protein
MALGGARRPRARATCWLLWPPAEVYFIQLSKIRGAANGKVETSRGRKSPAQEVYGALREYRRKGDIRVKREPLNPLYREEKRAFGV